MPQNKSELIHNASVVKSLRSAVEFCNINHVPQTIREVLKTGAWAERYEMMRVFTFKSFPDFITKPVREGGCGWNPPSNVEALLDKSGDIEAQAMFREAMVGKQGAHHNNVMMKGRQGNSRAYTLVRLKEKKPELYKRVVNGELSANAAAIKAGFRKKPVKRCPKCGHEW
jgi:hypothetical protein